MESEFKFVLLINLRIFHHLLILLFSDRDEKFLEFF